MKPRSIDRCPVPRRLAIAAAGLAISVAPALAQAPPPQSAAAPVTTLPDTVIAADRIEVPASQVNASVTVVTAAEIERRQFRTLNDVLRAVPGVTVSQSGGAGKMTTVFTRGANGNHTLVLIDGVRAGDPGSINGAPNFAHFMLDNVERVEVVRGPMSTLYGSDAIGGVINVVTKRGKGAPSATAFAETGTRGTVDGGAALQGAAGRFDYNVAVVAASTRGQTATPPRFSPGIKNEPDGYWNVALNARLGVALAENFHLSSFTRAGVARNEYDAFPSEDPNLREKAKQVSQRLQGDLELFDGRWKQTLGLSFLQVTRRDTDGEDPVNFTPFAPDSRNRGRRWQLDWKNDLRVDDMLGAVFGIDAERTSLRGRNTYNFGFPSTAVDKSVGTVGGYVNLRWMPVDGTTLTAGGRLEDNSAFGTAATFRVGGAHEFKPSGTRVRASYGTAFKAPSLDQLYYDFPAFGFFANPNLKPERSRGGEIGVDQSLLGERLKLGATVFHTDIRNLIASAPCGAFCTTLVNARRARSQGVETYVEFRPWSDFTIRLDYTFTNAIDRTASEPLLRRPRHAFDVTATWTPIERLTLGAEFKHRGGNVDRDFTAFPSPIVHLEAYSLVRVTASYDVTEAVQVFGRVENLFDKRYEEPFAFQAPKLAAFAGARFRF